MSGLDKIISQIKEEANASAAKILEEANATAEEIKKEADAQCRETAERAKTQNEAAREDVLRKSRSAAQMERRRNLLIAKQELIDEVISEAHAAMLALDTPDYFASLAKLVEKHAQAQSGEVHLSQKDLSRIPADFSEAVAEAAKKKGGTLTISEQPCEIDGGFVLSYGDIEENCSFDALFVSERENLQDQLNTFLFA